MSNKAIAISVGVLLILVGVLVFLSKARTPSGPTPAELAAAATLRFDPAALVSLTIARPNTLDEKVERADSGRWTWSRAKVSWPASMPESAKASIARLSDLAPAGRDAPDVPAGGPTITVGLRDGLSRTIRLAPTPLGGRLAAQVISPGAEPVMTSIEAASIAPLLDPGLAAWRIKSALPGARDCSRLTLEEGKDSVSLAKLQGVWSVRRPIASRADQAAVESLLGALEALRIERFEDKAPADAASTGLAKPRLTITLETDERSADAAGKVQVNVIVRRLQIGGPASPDGSLLFAAPNDSADMLLVLPASSIAAISTAPRNYLASTCTAVLPQNVFMLTITGLPGSPDRAYRRDLARWVQVDGSTRTPVDAGPLEELLLFLNSRPGEAEAAGPPDELRPIGRIELFDLDGDAIELLNIGYTTDGVLAFRSGNLIVMFKSTEAPAILNLPTFDQLPPAPGAPPPVSVPPTAPTGK